jgi:hypothetical protein
MPTRGHGDKLAGREEQVILALLTHGTVEAAAAALRVDPSTLRRWLRLPSFRRKYLAARGEMFDAGVAQLQAGLLEAVAVLRLQLRAAKPSDKIKAAMGFIDRTLRARQVVDVEEQLQRVEEMHKQIMGQVRGGPGDDRRD